MSGLTPLSFRWGDLLTPALLLRPLPPPENPVALVQKCGPAERALLAPALKSRPLLHRNLSGASADLRHQGAPLAPTLKPRPPPHLKPSGVSADLCPHRGLPAPRPLTKAPHPPKSQWALVPRCGPTGWPTDVSFIGVPLPMGADTNYALIQIWAEVFLRATNYITALINKPQATH